MNKIEILVLATFLISCATLPFPLVLSNWTLGLPFVTLSRMWIAHKLSCFAPSLSIRKCSEQINISFDNNVSVRGLKQPLLESRSLYWDLFPVILQSMIYIWLSFIKSKYLKKLLFQINCRFDFYFHLKHSY